MKMDLFLEQFNQTAQLGSSNVKMNASFSDILDETNQLSYPLIFESHDLISLFGTQ